MELKHTRIWPIGTANGSEFVDCSWKIGVLFHFLRLGTYALFTVCSWCSVCRARAPSDRFSVFSACRCRPACGSGQWSCGAGVCVAASARCDGRSDCANMSDERDCRTIQPAASRRCLSVCLSDFLLPSFAWNGHSFLVCLWVSVLGVVTMRHVLANLARHMMPILSCVMILCEYFQTFFTINPWIAKGH